MTSTTTPFSAVDIKGVTGTEKEERLLSQGSNTCRANPRRGPAASNAFWGEITQMQRVPEKAPPHALQKSNLLEGLEAAATTESRLCAPEANSPISSLVALSFLNSFLF